MKYVLSLLLFATLGVASAQTGAPQQTTSVHPALAQAGQSQSSTPEGITEHNIKKYNAYVKNFALTPDQQVQVKAVLDRRVKKEIANLSAPPEERAAGLHAIDQEARAGIRAILNPEQLAKFNKGLQDEADRIAARKAKNAGASPPAASSTPPPPSSPQR